MARVEFGPGSRIDQRGNVILVLKAWNRVIWLFFEEGTRDPARFARFEQRQAAAMDQIVHERGNEDGLAGT